jgi:hypothetical protein
MAQSVGFIKLDRFGFSKREDPEGDWWELWDEHNKLPYYYNTLTGTTEWFRPENKTIIPLMKIQVMFHDDKPSSHPA